MNNLSSASDLVQPLAFQERSPEVWWGGWGRPLLALLPVIGFQRTREPGLWFSLGQFAGREVLEAPGIRKGGRWRREIRHLGKKSEGAWANFCRKEKLKPFSSEETVVPSSPSFPGTWEGAFWDWLMFYSGLL